MHPYNQRHDNSFWSRAVSRNFSASELFQCDGPLIKRDDKIVSAGSCFAANIVPYLEKHGLTYLKTERAHRLFKGLGQENFGYEKFSAAYGNIYTARQLLQLLRRCVDEYHPVEDRWITAKGIIDPFRPGLKYHALSEREFEVLQQQHLRYTRDAFSQADVFIYTLGLTEAWVSTKDGSVFPACPGTVSGTFDPELHAFHNFSVSEIISDLNLFIKEIRRLSPNVKLILTVSPVPLAATATTQHVLCASAYSKSVLRVAAQEAVDSHVGVYYFPAFEIITGPQAPAEFFEADRREVSAAGIDAVMSSFICHCENGDGSVNINLTSQSSVTGLISKAIADAACEEVMVE